MAFITRFAPSPTGYVHIGTARTALFNYLLTRHHNGKFLLRIEDTDKKRHMEEAVQPILDSLQWLGIDWDDEPVFQSDNIDRHIKIAHSLLEKGKAYNCYLSQEELESLRVQARKENKRLESPWRDKDPDEAPENISPVIRIKAPCEEGSKTIQDLVQGPVTLNNQELDDFILLRSDGTPTYMLSVVVDDHDMNITHVIRGDDHLVNAFRQTLIFEAMGWTVPSFAHIPMIHANDGSKLSKRHGATGLHEFKEMGYLPESLFNYLMRLGWGHGDDEIISKEQAIEWFDFNGLNKSPAKLDFKKLNQLNAHYIKQKDNQELVDLILPDIEKMMCENLSRNAADILLRAMPSLKERGETLMEIKQAARTFVQSRPIPLEKNANDILTEEALSIISQLTQTLQKTKEFDADNLQETINTFIADKGLKFKTIGMPMRAALLGTLSAPAVHEIAAALGKDETIARLQDALQEQNPLIEDAA